MVKASGSFIRRSSVGPGGDGTRVPGPVLMVVSMFGLIEDHLVALKLKFRAPITNGVVASCCKGAQEMT